ncbi:hypothetical protein ACOME3_006852 [Neoechinorhynchus agilis]
MTDDTIVLKLAPFQQVPKLDFGSIPIGSMAVERHLVFSNPTKKPITVRFLDSSREFKSNVSELTVDALSSSMVTFSSSPNEIGQFRRTIVLKLNSGLSLQITAFGSCVEENKKTKRKRLKVLKPNCSIEPECSLIGHPLYLPRKRSFTESRDDLTPKIVRLTGEDGDRLILVRGATPPNPIPLKELNNFFELDDQECDSNHFRSPPPPPPNEANVLNLQEQALLAWLNHILSNPLCTTIDDTLEDNCPRQLEITRSYVHLKSQLSLQIKEANSFCRFEQAEFDLRRKLELKPNVYFTFDAGARDFVCELMLNYNPILLKLTLETLFPSRTRHDSLLKRCIKQLVLDNTSISRRFAIPNLLRAFKDGHKEEIAWHVVWTVFKVAHFLDLAKRLNTELKTVCLFTSSSTVKSTHDLIMKFSREFILTNALTTMKILLNAGFSAECSQKPIEEYCLIGNLNDINTDLRDGIRFARLAEMLCRRQKLKLDSFSIRCPASSVVLKLQNHRYALELLSNNFKLNLSGIDARNLALGNKKQTLDLLWRIVFGIELEHVVDVVEIAREILFLKRYSRSMQSKTSEEMEKQLLLNLLLNSKRLGAIQTEDEEDECQAEDRDFERSFDASSKLFPPQKAAEGRWIIGLLFKWAYLICEIRGFKLHNLTSSFSSGLPPYLIISHYRPDLLTSRDLTVNGHEAPQKAFGIFRAVSKATYDLGRSPHFALKTKSDCVEGTLPDQKCVVLQLAFLASRLLEVQTEQRSARVIWNAWLKFRTRRFFKNIFNKHERIMNDFTSLIKQNMLVRQKRIHLIPMIDIIKRLEYCLKSSISIERYYVYRSLESVKAFSSTVQVNAQYRAVKNILNAINRIFKRLNNHHDMVISNGFELHKMFLHVCKTKTLTAETLKASEYFQKIGFAQNCFVSHEVPNVRKISALMKGQDSTFASLLLSVSSISEATKPRFKRKQFQNLADSCQRLSLELKLRQSTTEGITKITALKIALGKIAFSTLTYLFEHTRSAKLANVFKMNIIVTEQLYLINQKVSFIFRLSEICVLSDHTTHAAELSNSIRIFNVIQNSHRSYEEIIKLRQSLLALSTFIRSSIAFTTHVGVTQIKKISAVFIENRKTRDKITDLSRLQTTCLRISTIRFHFPRRHDLYRLHVAAVNVSTMIFDRKILLDLSLISINTCHLSRAIQPISHDIKRKYVMAKSFYNLKDRTETIIGLNKLFRSCRSIDVIAFPYSVDLRLITTFLRSIITVQLLSKIVRLWKSAHFFSCQMIPLSDNESTMWINNIKKISEMFFQSQDTNGTINDVYVTLKSSLTLSRVLLQRNLISTIKNSASFTDFEAIKQVSKMFRDLNKTRSFKKLSDMRKSCLVISMAFSCPFNYPNVQKTRRLKLVYNSSAQKSTIYNSHKSCLSISRIVFPRIDYNLGITSTTAKHLSKAMSTNKFLNRIKPISGVVYNSLSTRASILRFIDLRLPSLRLSRVIVPSFKGDFKCPRDLSVIIRSSLNTQEYVSSLSSCTFQLQQESIVELSSSSEDSIRSYEDEDVSLRRSLSPISFLVNYSEPNSQRRCSFLLFVLIALRVWWMWFFVFSK